MEHREDNRDRENMTNTLYNKTDLWHLVNVVYVNTPYIATFLASRTADPGIQSCFVLGEFSGSIHVTDLKIGTPVATLPSDWRYRVSPGTGWPGVSILRLGEIKSLICNFHLSVAACTLSKHTVPEIH